MKKDIAVVFGGRSVEHEVSVITGMQVMENMDKSKYNIIPIFIDKDGKWYTGDELQDFDNFKNKSFNNLREIVITPIYNEKRIFGHPDHKIGIFSKKFEQNIDAAFIALHGTNGEDGTIQGLFELVNIPYVSAGTMGSAVGMDKIIMKDVYKAYDLPIVKYTWFFRSAWELQSNAVITKVENEIGYPVFVKPSNLGSSIGISRANDRNELTEAIDIAMRFDRKIIVEEALIKPREINCAVMGYNNNVKASLCEEPVGWKDLLTYEDKYIHSNAKGTKGGGRNIPADLSEEKTKEIQDLAKEAFMAIDCKGNARIDFLMDKDNKVYINEINTQPGSIAYYLWEPMGINFTQLIDELLDIAYAVQSEKEENMYSYDVDLFDKVNLGKDSKAGEM
ncbi:MAG: D-alanine--D-alanine ligase family protein [Andreesenia angusta]|nr:D-alanine--D-alanine ligase family protein [Andreesenia angusta]